MNSRMRIAMLFASVFWTASQAQIATDNPTGHGRTVAPLGPAPGLWWQHDRTGNFWSIDVGPGGYAFVQLSTFDESRAPIFLVMQGQLQMDPETAKSAAFLRSPLYQLTGGPCLGCATSRADISESRFGSAELRFSSPTQGEFQWRGIRYPIELFPLYTRAEDTLEQRLPGYYQVNWQGRSGPKISSNFVQIRPSSRADCGLPGTSFELYCPGNACDQTFNAEGAASAAERQQLQSLLDGIELSTSSSGDYLQARYRSAVTGQCSSPWTAGESNGALLLSDSVRSGESPGRLELRKLESRVSGPERGLWWQQSNQENGRFWSIDIGPGGYMFVNLATFDESGQPIFLTMQGPFEPRPETLTGPVGSLHSTLYQIVDGQCLGCSDRQGVVSPSRFGSAEIRFLSAQRAEFIWRGQTTLIERFPLYNRVRDFPQMRLPGVYRLNGGFSGPLVVLEPVVPACALESPDTMALRLRCREERCGGIIGSRPVAFGAALQQLIESTELHLDFANHAQLSGWTKASNGSCLVTRRVDEREGRIDAVAAEGTEFGPLIGFSLLPLDSLFEGD